MAGATVARPRSSSELSDYCLDRLFDPEDLYYVPIDELIKRYKKRDLRPAKLFNIAKKYAQEPETRKRIIVAPPMERVSHRFSEPDSYYKPPEKVFYCSKPNPLPTDRIEAPKSAYEQKESDREAAIKEYQQWLEMQHKLREEINGLRLNAEYLKRKKDLTELEKRVLKKMTHVDVEMQTDEIYEKRIRGMKSAERPKIVLPIPMAMEKIEQAIEEKKWRLLDLFKDLDKNKDWKVNREDFIREYASGNLDVTDVMLDELLMAYGNSHKLEYKNLAKDGSNFVSDSYETQKTGDKFKDISTSTAFRTMTDSFLSDNTKQTPRTVPKIQKGSEKTLTVNEPDSKNQRKASIAKKSQDSAKKSLYLAVPEPDTREERFPDNFKDRAISAQSQFSIIEPSKHLLNRQKLENSTSINLKASFREKIEGDYEKCLKFFDLDSSVTNIARALHFPHETERATIIKKLKDKETKKRDEEMRIEKEKRVRLRKLQHQKMFKYS